MDQSITVCFSILLFIYKKKKFRNQNNQKPTKQKSCIKPLLQEPAIKGKSWRSLDLTHNHGQYSQTQILANHSHNITTTTSTTATTTNTTNSPATGANSVVVMSHNQYATHTYQRQDFKNRRSSSEPVQDYAKNRTKDNIVVALYASNNNRDGPTDDDQSKDSGYIECLQNISAVEVRIFLVKKKNNNNNYNKHTVARRYIIISLFFSCVCYVNNIFFSHYFHLRLSLLIFDEFSSHTSFYFSALLHFL